MTGTAACPLGKVVLGGGALVTTTNTDAARVLLQSSHADTTTTWRADAIVTAAPGAGRTMSIRAFALCSPQRGHPWPCVGRPSATASRRRPPRRGRVAAECERVRRSPSAPCPDGA